MPPIHPPAADAWAILNLTPPAAGNQETWWEAMITLYNGLDDDADRYPLPIGG